MVVSCVVSPALLDLGEQRAPELARLQAVCRRPDRLVGSDLDVAPAVHAVQVRVRPRSLHEVGGLDAAFVDVAHAIGIHDERHEPRTAALGRDAVTGRRVRHPVLERIVELDRVRDERVRQQRSEGFGTHRNFARSTRFVLASNGFQRSPRSAMRARTLSTRKSSMAKPRSTSSHVTGVETVASGVGRTE